MPINIIKMITTILTACNPDCVNIKKNIWCRGASIYWVGY